MLCGKTWLWWLNYCILQWFFVRLARSQDSSGNHVGFVLWLGWVPLTGWGEHDALFIAGEPGARHMIWL